MRFHFALFPLSALLLSACEFEPAHQPEAPAEAEDRSHLKSFSWKEAGPGGLGTKAAQETRFDSESALLDAVRKLEADLRLPGRSDSLWKPVNAACDELDLALWNAHGRVFLRDSLILDKDILEARCRTLEGPAALSKSSSNPATEAVDRRHPYKMIGNSWKNFNALVYASSGGETQFKKNREKFGVTAWYDTDAARIGVRSYLFDCTVQVGRRICWQRASKSEAQANDDYVSVREFAAGLEIGVPLKDHMPELTRAPIPSWTPAQLRARVDALPENFSAGANFIDLRPFLGDYQVFTQSQGIKVPLVGTVRLRVADAVLSLHSVDHAGLRFRAVSSVGLGDYNSALTVRQFDFVTW
jgi:hypothetical protein